MESSACEEAVSPSRSLVLVGCSRRKVTAPGLLPAIERYDGPVFRLLRRILRTSPRPICIYILSAAYGLIPADQPIPWYDCQMTAERATALRPTVDETLRAITNVHPFTEVFVCMGTAYRQALPDLAAYVAAAVPIHTASGTMGRQLGMLHDWLYGEPPRAAGSTRTSGTVRLRGIECSITADEALTTAHEALLRGDGAPHAFQSWYVRVGDRRVAPKWLISCLTGVPVSTFTTDEARRVLAQIGIPVWRA